MRQRRTLRGSVQQNSTTVRLRARETSRFGIVARTGIAALVCVILIGMCIWAFRSGWVHREGAQITETGLRLTQKAHFAVSDIVVEGRQQTNKDQLFAAIEAESGSPIFAFKPADAEARIAKLPWVESATVERRLPDTVFVRLTEHVPLARWQHDNHVAVIDGQGKVLPEANPDQFGSLPLVVGAGAPAETKALLDTLHMFPTVAQNSVASVRVGERRWDLHLPSNVVARLPEDDVAGALKRLSILISEQKILERDIVAIDLRMPDRLTVEQGNPPHAATGEGHK